MRYWLILFLALSLYPCQAEGFQDIAFMEVQEVSSEPGLVSTLGKEFRLVIHHDPAYLPAETLASFDRKKSPLLSNLQIIRRDLNRKKKNPKNVRSDFQFQLEEDSSPSSEYNGFLVSRYISNTQVIKKATRFNFKIETFDYLDDLQVIETKGLRTKFNDKYDINALKLEFNNVNLNGDSLSFSAKKPDKKDSKIISNDLIVESTIETSINLSDSIKNVVFKSQSAAGKKIASKIKKDGSKGNQSHRLIPKVEKEDILIKNTALNTYQINIPVTYLSKKKLTKAEREGVSDLDLLIMPIFLNIKTSDSRDLELSGILRDKVNIEFDNGSTSETKIK